MKKENIKTTIKKEIFKKDFLRNLKKNNKDAFEKPITHMTKKNKKKINNNIILKIINNKNRTNIKKCKYLNKSNFLNIYLLYIYNIINFLIVNFFLLFFPSCLTNNLDIIRLNSLSEISLTINGIGNQSILSNDFTTIPNQIFVNGILQNTTGKIVYNLQNNINNITIIWNDQLTSCSSMFYNLTNILKADLSKFDSSKVIKMNNMFCCCKSLTSLNLSNLNTSIVTNMNSMFRECILLTSINLTSFDTSSVTDMGSMFYVCDSLISLNLSNFNTSSVINMNGMFSGCKSITSLKLNNFNTSSVNNMGYMFYGCNVLELLNLNNFDTSSVTFMKSMFSYCYNLKSLNLNNFDVKKVTNTTSMFENCTSLKLLDLSSFITSSIQNTENMFKYCISLISLNINNFNISSTSNINNMFHGCKSLISLNLRAFHNFNSEITTNYENLFYNCNESLRYCFNSSIEQVNTQLANFSNNNCSDDCFTNLKNKFIIERRQCIDDCSNDNYYKYEYESICYHACPEGTHQSLQNNYLCKDDFFCDNYYNYEYTGCIDNIPEGYYLKNLSLKTIDKCDIKCRNCTLESLANNSCISCNSNESYYPKFNDSLNNNSFIKCYNEELEGYYLDNGENMYKPCYSRCKTCTELGDENDNKCTGCLSIYTLLINGNCYKDDEYNSEEITNNSDNDIYINKDIEYFINQYINLNNILDTLYYYYNINLDNIELKIKFNNRTYIYFPQDTKKNIIYIYNLKEKKDNIYVLIIESLTNNINNINRNYNYKLILENGTFLNLNKINEDSYIEVYVPITEFNLPNFNYCLYFAEQGYDIYDKKSNFYNDICSPAYLYENDITLSDRKKDIYPNNSTLCKDNCQYKSVNIEEKRIICECNLNVEANYTNEEDDFLKEEDDGNFISYLLDYINYKILKCYNLLITFKNLKNNYAFYIIISIFIINIILYLIFCLYEIFSIRKITIKYFPNEQKIYEETMTEMKRLKSINIRTNSKKIASKRHTSKTINQKNDKKETTETRKKTYITSRVEIYDYSENRNEINDTNIKEKDDQTKEGNLNELPFTLAIQKDNRSAPQIFVSILIEKIEFVHLIIGNHNIKVILIFEYILSSLIDFLINTLLYSDDIVSQKYHNNGKLDFVVTLLLSILSNIITSFICNILSFSDGIEEILEEIIQIKKENAYLFAVNKFMKILKVKVFLSFVIQILFISFFFYYVVIFCIVYNHSQKSLLTNYSSSLVESLITSVTISVIVAVIRKIGIICLSNKLYNTSKFINSRF